MLSVKFTPSPTTSSASHDAPAPARQDELSLKVSQETSQPLKVEKPLSSRNVCPLPKEKIHGYICGVRERLIKLMEQFDRDDGIKDCIRPYPHFFHNFYKMFWFIDLLPLEEQGNELEKLTIEIEQLYERVNKSEFLRGVYSAVLYGQMERVDRELELQEELKRHQVFRTMPPREFWRMCIDAAMHKYGKFTFENEPGYLAGMFAGFNLMLHQQREGTPVSCELIRELALKSTKFVYKVRSDGQFKELETDLIGGGVLYGSRGMSKEGLIEKISSSKTIAISGSLSKASPLISYQENFYNQIDYISENSTLHAYFNEKEEYSRTLYIYETTPVDSAAIETRMKVILSTYYSDINNALSEKDKLWAIVKCINDFMLLHPFIDGNGRTFQILLCNRLLLDNNLTPVMWDDPSIVCEYSRNEILQELIKGQDNFRRLCAGQELLPPLPQLQSSNSLKTIS